ncbi:HNH homing endonuclease [Escherichia phage W70]|nr:HNH homing endonuclease [Escherichia phage W70]
MVRIEENSPYFITEDGQVFSEFSGRFLKNSLSKGTGYFVVNVILNGKRKPEYVHRMVAKAYIPNPLNLPEVNHKDGNKLNNHKDNLEWVTEEENLRHSIENKLPIRGQDHYSTGLSENDVHKICQLLSEGWTAKRIAESSGIQVKRAVVLNIRSKRDWKEIANLYTWTMYPEYAKSSTTSRKA